MDKFDVLRKYFGYSSFRKGQEEMVDCLLSGRDALGIMPTGAGKSICYQVPAIMFGGVTIVVSPLISLMKDQVNALVQQGVKAAYINSSLTDTQYDKVLKNAALGIYKIIYVAPERLESVNFINLCRRIKISMVAVDESHCVSQWGQDFRLSYLNINKFISVLPNRPIIGAFTATATDEVKKDIVNILQLDNPAVVTTGFDRPNLFFSVLRSAKKDSRLIELIKERRDKSGIIYCSTRKKVESVCDLLIKNGFPATRYHAGLSDEERVKNQDDFVYDRKPVMVATNAFGMGIDKSNVSYVIHYNMPKNIESYYQEAGRAGRDGQEADCILLYGAGDVQTCRYFIENTEPNPQLTPEQNEMFKKREEEHLKHMIFYCRTSDCLRNYMLRYFGDEAEENCGKCSNCLTKFETADVTIEAQKILSCIIRTGQKFGATIISDVLRGKTNDRITSFGLDRQSTFGIMKDSKPTEIRYIIEKLEEQGYIISVGAEYIIEDKRNIGSPVNLKFKGELYAEQQSAVNEMLKYENGVLSATTAFGKTVVASYIIALRSVNTLILVHSAALLEQWEKSLSQFLTFEDKLPQQPTTRGREKKISHIGLLGSGKNTFNGKVDIAIMQSSIKDNEVKEFVKDYGMVIVDECHHVSAFSFEKILKTVNAKYVYGLTATPVRQDGHHPIIFMQAIII